MRSRATGRALVMATATLMASGARLPADPAARAKIPQVPEQAGLTRSVEVPEAADVSGASGERRAADRSARPAQEVAGSRSCSSEDAGPSASAPPDPVETAHAEAVRVRRARYPVRIVETRPGACDGLSPDRVEMLIGGAPTEVEAIERSRLRTIHAVLIDTSPSMQDRGRLEKAIAAARGYARSLPRDEPILLATFDEDLVLRLPPTRDRDALDRALDRIDVGAYTALNDALYHTIRYLRPRPERKVLVVLTDGCDTASLTTHPFDAVLDLAATAENLSVFPIGIDLPARCSGGLSRIGPVVGPDILAHRLGEISGGELFRVRQAGEIATVFGSIRERLDQEGYLVYRPPSHPESSAGSRREGRRIRIRTRMDRGCRVERAASELRFEEIDDTGIRVSWQGAPVASAALPREVPLELRFPEPWRRAVVGGGGSLTLEPERLRGTLPDIEIDRGPLYSERIHRRSGRYRTLRNLFAGYRAREFRLEVPGLAKVRREITGPAALARHLIERGDPPFVRDEQGETRLAAGWIHGQTLLEVRGVLARALYAYDDYRRWADLRLRSMEREELLGLLDQSDLTPNEQRAFLESVEGDRYVAAPSDPQRVLTEWLGDLSPARLAAEIDREAADAALGADERAASDAVGALWPKLLSWFPPPTRFRVIVPLVPVFEPEREVVGFYRIVLPVSIHRRKPGGLPPVAPIGTLLAERLRTDGGRVDGLDYPEIDRAMGKTLRRLARTGGGGKPAAVRLELRGADGIDRAITGYFLLKGDAWSHRPVDDPEPVLACVEWEASGSGTMQIDAVPCRRVRAASR